MERNDSQESLEVYGKNEVETGPQQEKPDIPYPKRVFFIVCTEFCERFNYYGMQTILYLYLTNKLHLDDRTATIQQNVFNMVAYFTCIFGGILSDSLLGKFKTITILSILYAIGSALVAFGAMPTFRDTERSFFYVGLLFIALGSGGIKPCVSAFGGDQFQLPEQSEYMDKFFSVFYFMINAGSLISTTLTPILRGKVHCYGENDCYPLAFGVPAILMIVAVAIFVSGRQSYTVVPPSGNMLVKVIKCIWTAITTKWRNGHEIVYGHFLDYSIDKHGPQLVNDTKCLLNILVLLIPQPFFWMLYNQQGSYWVDQAGQMDLHIGSLELAPDQMQILNPVLILAFIPLFDYGVYPLLSKIGLRRPLQKMSMGGILAALSFLVTAIVQWEIEKRPPNTMSILWQVPQIIVITAAEIMFSITSLSFSFEQAPKSMKSVVQACFLLTVSIGSALLAILSSVRIFAFQSYDYILFECLMLSDMLVFIVLAHRYKPNAL